MKSTQLFPDIVIPDCIIDAVRSGLLTDISWGNDEAPSFMLATHASSDGADEAPRLFVQSQDEDERDAVQSCRYIVSTMSDTLMETDSVSDALSYLVGSSLFKIQTVCTNGWADLKQSNEYGNYVADYYSTIAEAEAELADFCDPENYRIVSANTPANEDLYN